MVMIKKDGRVFLYGELTLNSMMLKDLSNLQGE
jgi:hypothetical protein